MYLKNSAVWYIDMAMLKIKGSLVSYSPSASLSGFNLILRSQQVTEFLCTMRANTISNFVPFAVKCALSLPCMNLFDISSRISFENGTHLWPSSSHSQTTSGELSFFIFFLPSFSLLSPIALKEAMIIVGLKV